jgi:S-adenosylmethionine-dependent methyltransferase
VGQRRAGRHRPAIESVPVANSWSRSKDSVEPRFLKHYDSVRGGVRKELVARQLIEHLPSAPLTIADVGGGAGEQTLALAKLGHEITLIDPSSAMLAEARRRIDAAAPEVRDRITVVESTAEDAWSVVGEGCFDVVLCHGVLMYVEDPLPLMEGVARLARPNGFISLVTKNASAIAMRAGLEGRYDDALAALRSDRDLGRLGVVTRGHTLQGLADMLWTMDVRVVEWYGVRVFTDHLPDDSDLPLGEALQAEWEAARMDPYRQVGRLLHVVARKTLPGSDACDEVVASG